MRWLIDEKTEVVIVGTYPGDASLREGHYYMDPRNQFWKIMTKILRDEYGNIKEDLTETAPERRDEILLENRIGLMDALTSCERRGSLDKDIVAKNHVNKKEIMDKFPQVIFLSNGNKAHDWFIKQPHDEYINQILTAAPSTSGSNTHDTIEDKAKVWKRSLDIFQLWDKEKKVEKKRKIIGYRLVK